MLDDPIHLVVEANSVGIIDKPDVGELPDPKLQEAVKVLNLGRVYVLLQILALIGQIDNLVSQVGEGS